MAYIRSGGGAGKKPFTINKMFLTDNRTGYCQANSFFDVSDYNNLDIESTTYTGNPNVRTLYIYGDGSVIQTITIPTSNLSIDISSYSSVGLGLRMGLPTNPSGTLYVNKIVFS